MKKWSNSDWKSKPAAPTKKKRFIVQYFYSFSEQPMYKTVNADDSQQAVAKFQEAVKWDYNTIGTIVEENEKK